jgi:hypothetical protein
VKAATIINEAVPSSRKMLARVDTRSVMFIPPFFLCS